MLARFNWQSQSKGKTTTSQWRYRIILTVLSAAFLLWISYRFILQPDWIPNLPTLVAEILNLIDAAWGLTLLILWGIYIWRYWHKTPKTKLLTDIESIYALSPADFEAFVGDLFKRKGYTVKLRGRSGDQGVDVEVIQSNGKRAVVQCKRYRHTVGPDIVRELFGTMIHEHAHHAFLVTTAPISESAFEWAQYKPMTLIDGDSLVKIASELQYKP
ncbi:MAG: restriction endonuclease [Anaerolineales bacterium]|nr:restriction endonuclease [Anaerolineales bacterium]